MKSVLSCLTLLALFLGAPAVAGPLKGSSQVVLVLADSWDSPRGELRLYERAGGGWAQSGPAVAVELGRAGLAWGRGLHAAKDAGPMKKEGDGRAPAGIFRLGTAFGYAPASRRRLAVAYAMMRESDVCVDDAASPRYNTVFDASGTPRDWSSFEAMRRKDHQYELGVVVEHNTDPALPGAGSCIFLHVRKSEGSPTAGCTAMPLADLERLAAWLDPAKRPLLVQLPRAEQARFERLYAIP